MKKLISLRCQLLIAVTSLVLAGGACPLGAQAAAVNGADSIPISDIQGSGFTSPLVDQTVTTTGIITAVQPGRGGLVLQTPSAQVSSNFKGSSALFVALEQPEEYQVGQQITLTGTVAELKGVTTILAKELKVESSGQIGQIKIPTLPFPHDPVEAQARELMLFHPGGTYRVNGNDELIYTGQLTLSDGPSPLLQPTQVGEAGSVQAQQQATYNQRHAVILDDGNDAHFDVKYSEQIQATPPEQLPYLRPGHPGPTLGATLSFKTAMLVRSVEGKTVMDPALTVSANQEAISFSSVREAQPATVGGNFKLATFNVLNYFSDLGVDSTDTDGDGKALCQPTYNLWDHTIPVAGNWDCPRRGAWDSAGLGRQQAKIVKAINQLGTAGAQVVALQEIENGIIFGDDYDVAVKHLVSALNQADPQQGWAIVPAPEQLPVYGNQDKIRQAFIYKPSQVKLDGKAFFLDDPVFQSAADARAPIAQKFIHLDSGKTILVVNNHLTYKGGKVVGEDNQNPGDKLGPAWDTGRNNGDRTRQAQALAQFATAHTSADQVTVLVGDFNAYSYESPIQTLVKAGFSDLMDTQLFPSQHSATPWNEYTYNYQATFGSLDHILLNQAGYSALTSMDIWTANAYEPKALEYSRFGFTGTNYYSEDAFRASDHNAALVGFNFPVEDQLSLGSTADNQENTDAISSIEKNPALDQDGKAADNSRSLATTTAAGTKPPARLAKTGSLALYGYLLALSTLVSAAVLLSWHRKLTATC